MSVDTSRGVAYISTSMPADLAQLARRIRDARMARNWSQRELAAATRLRGGAGVSYGYIQQLEREVIRNPGKFKLDAIADALGYASIDALLSPQSGASSPAAPRSGVPDDPTRTFANVVGRLEDLRPPGSRPLPVYRWGACGDPRDHMSAPDPDHLDYSPVGRESLVGPNGFAVLVKGESMANRSIHDGDTVWVNPDLPPRTGRPVLVRCWSDEDQEVGMVIKLFKNVPGERLVSDGEGAEGRAPLLCARYDIIGPVVWIERGFPPG